MVSISDVAKAAGVSATTVSHVLSGRRPVAEATRHKVHATMEALGYVPMRSARNLALGRTMLVALLVPDVGNPFFAELAKGVERAAARHGYNVVLANTGFDRDTALNHLELVSSRAVDGVIYSAGALFSDTEIAAAIGDLPLITVDETVAGTSAPLVTSDNIAGGALMARHLLSLGHRRPLVLHAAPGLASSENRVQGFVDEWLAGGGELPLFADGGFTFDGGRDAFSQQLDGVSSECLTAVFATNDEMALGAMSVCREQGIDVPSQIAVAGFDGILMGRMSWPALTTVYQNVAEMGEIASERLIASLSGGDALTADTTVLPVELHIRESTAQSTVPGKEE